MKWLFFGIGILLGILLTVAAAFILVKREFDKIKEWE